MSRARLFATIALFACVVSVRADAMTGGIGQASARGPASGDLSGSYPNPTVSAINGTTVPVTTSGEIGYTLTVADAGVATWQAQATAQPTGNWISWADLAAAQVAQGNGSVGFVAMTNAMNSACFFTTSAKTATGGKFYWHYSGSGTDVVTVRLWSNASGTPLLATASSVSITSSGTYAYTFSPSVAIQSYLYYVLGVFASNGYTKAGALSSSIGNSISNNVNSAGNPTWPGTMMGGSGYNWATNGFITTGTGFPGIPGAGQGNSTYTTADITLQ